MSIKFDVQMTPKIMYDFTLYHTYTHVSGILGAFFGVVTLGLAIRAGVQGDYNSALMFFVFTFIFLVMAPIQLRQKSARQVKRSVIFQEPISYEITEAGVNISQKDQSQLTEWNSFCKIAETGSSLLLYTSRISAMILPKKAIGEQYVSVIRMIFTNASPKIIKIKQVRQ